MIILLLVQLSLTADPQGGAVTVDALDEYIGDVRRAQNSCGPRAAWYCLRRMGVEVRGEEILNRFSIGSEGVPLRDVAEVLGSYKPSAAAVKIQDRDLGVVPIPAILILRNSHCVVYEGFSEEDGRVRVFDPTTAAVEKWESDVVRDEWSGQAIVFEPIWRLSKLSLGAVSLLTAVITFGGLRWGVRLLARGVQKAIK